MKQLLWTIGIIVAIIGLSYGVYRMNTTTEVVDTVDGERAAVPTPPPSATPEPGTPDVPVVTETPPEAEDERETVIGSSVLERDIVAYHFGTGDRELLFVGGIHGGYAWNSVLLAYALIDTLETDPTAIPEGVRVTVIPVLNPDGLYTTMGTADRFTAPSAPVPTSKAVAGRFNAHQVDLNRNFDCKWQAKGVWQSTEVSGGGAAFSEPESQAIRDYITTHTPSAVVVWYSAAGGVYASQCEDGILTDTRTLMDVYATASGYPAHDQFESYALSGDMVNWLAQKNIPAISVLLTNHTDIEWNKNWAGIKALLKQYGA